MTTGHHQLVAHPPSRARRDRDLTPLNAVSSQHRLCLRHCTRDSQRSSRKEQTPRASPSLRLSSWCSRHPEHFSFHQLEPSDVTFLRKPPISPSDKEQFSHPNVSFQALITRIIQFDSTHIYPVLFFMLSPMADNKQYKEKILDSTCPRGAHTLARETETQIIMM